jgi:NAD(P)-dependent dehydrogenase (short-subunit alcohol dehydrogenase family)
MDRLSGKIALITGAANGIGRGVALRLAAEGADLALVDIEAGPLAEVRQQISALGRRAIGIELDCVADGAPDEALRQAEAQLGPVDILINNVGQGARERKATYLESKEEVWRFVIELNLMTTMRFTQPFARAMVDRKAGGRIINMASESAVIAPVMSHDYAAAKAGIIGFTRSIARELAPHAITSNAILPGPIRTRGLERSAGDEAKKAIASILLPFLGEPEDIGAIAAMLASEDGRYMTGQSLLANGGRWFL